MSAGLLGVMASGAFASATHCTNRSHAARIFGHVLGSGVSFELDAVRAVKDEHVGDFGLSHHPLVLHLPVVVLGQSAFLD